MFKRNITFSAAVMTAIFIIGCGSSSDPKKNDIILPKVSDELRAFVKSSKSYEGKMDNLPSPTQAENQSPLAIEMKDCTNGGTINFTNDFNQTAVMQSPNDFNMTMTSKAIDCVESGMTLNGEIETFIHIVNQKSTMTLTYLTDFNITDGAVAYVIKKDSSVVSEDVDEDNTIDTENIEIISDGKSYKSIALKSNEGDKNNISTSYYISGKEIVDGVTYIVDESYDNSKTPMVYDADDNLLKGGKSLHKNDQNHSITIEAIEKNKIQISVDVNDDGKADQAEVVEI